MRRTRTLIASLLLALFFTALGTHAFAHAASAQSQSKGDDAHLCAFCGHGVAPSPEAPRIAHAAPLVELRVAEPPQAPILPLLVTSESARGPPAPARLS